MKQGNAFVIIILFLILPAGCDNNKLPIISSNDDSVQNRAVSPIEQALGEKKSEMPLLSDESLSLKKNPFLSAVERSNFSKQTKEIIDYLTVTAIFHSELNSHAVIDGRVLQKNDEIDGKEIVAINREEIILRDSLGEYVLKLKTY
ncbi:MAG: hypothetical protein KJ915_08750 [Candidatus Omnitrophica bacterium]|nr:hypothetical protein [Candidatus Omnitrophota bacterium]